MSPLLLEHVRRIPPAPTVGEQSAVGRPGSLATEVIDEMEDSGHEMEAGTFDHQPVMLGEVMAVLATAPSGPVLDATLGGGGHAAALLEMRPDATIIGMDRDERAIAAAADSLARFGDRVVLRHAAFGELRQVLLDLGTRELAGFIFDLGVSSPQLDSTERGFSYRGPGPLDMRMDRRQTRTAADVVNGYTESELADVLSMHSGERYARRIARALVAARPVGDTAELAELVRSAIPAPARRRGGHPAKRTFQAIRIEVNTELEQLPRALDEAIDRLVPGGRGVVLSYHSGEDRLVKDRFDTAMTGGCTCPPRLPCACGAIPRAVVARRRALRPTPEEVDVNPRASSARMRTVERA